MHTTFHDKVCTGLKELWDGIANIEVKEYIGVVLGAYQEVPTTMRWPE